MNNNLTKILIWVTLVLIFILSGFGVYRYFSKKTPTKTSPTEKSTTSAFPESSRIITPTDTKKTAVGDREATSQPTTKEEPSDQNRELAGSNIKIVSDKPVASGVFIERPTSLAGTTSKTTSLFVRYLERENGHISELIYNENLPKKISNTTITRVHQSFFNNSNTNILIRRLDENNNIQNISALLQERPATTSEVALSEDTVGKLNQSLLARDIKEVAISPNRNKIFYLTAVAGDFIGTIEDFGSKPGSTNKKQVFSSPLSEWLIQWPKDSSIFFNTKPAGTVPGYLYLLNLDSKGFSKILGGINGLTSNISPDVKKLIYSESTKTGIKTYFYDLLKKERSVLSLKTLPEKCTWGGIDKEILYCAVPSILPDGEYPDSWYQGLLSFSDELWKIDTKTGTSEILLSKSALERNGGMDAINLSLSPKEDYLLLTNKKDSSLWQIKLK